ncbi:MAG: hypothetical protein LGB07_03800, partial [Sulfurovum sp.]|nr:hypothetical protein [Sulfurovum sp.]
LTLGFTGCGSSSGNDTSSLSFPSDAKVAKPTIENGEKVKKVTTINQSRAVPGFSSSGGNVKSHTEKLKARKEKMSKEMLAYTQKDTDMQPYASDTEAVSVTEECTGGGTLSYSGNGNLSGAANLTYAANNCVEGNMKLNGHVHITVSNLDENSKNFKDYTIRYITDFTATDLYENSSEKISPDSHMEIHVTKFKISGEIEEYTLGTSIQATKGTEFYGLKDCIFQVKETNDTEEMYQTTGKVYIDNLDLYVEYDTSYDMSKTPFVFNKDTGELLSGKAIYKMDGNGKVKVVVEGNRKRTYVDTDGDGTYELSE